MSRLLINRIAGMTRDKSPRQNSKPIEKKHDRALVLKHTTQLLISSNENILQPVNEPNLGHKRFQSTFSPVTLTLIDPLWGQWIFLKSVVPGNEQWRLESPKIEMALESVSLESSRISGTVIGSRPVHADIIMRAAYCFL
jgi:hypothetical protein